MSGNASGIIPLEEGWNDEIKAKVCISLCHYREVGEKYPLVLSGIPLWVSIVCKLIA
jgi:hypothetical protein